ncbi:MAG: SH3 domain-containing protein, partial [Eubacteriales bacterium]|nr:SH3 domain-containing protein [Eubacteriales bacterium]
AGTFNVKAYAKKGTSWSTCDDGKTSVFVTSTTDDATTICAKRRASDGLIKMIATFEGYLPTVYDDPLTGDPTLGYGKLVFVGEQFYNNLSKEEAYAYLSQAVNNDGYTSKVNSFLIDNKVRFNQQQFDALVCFVYNVGTGVLSNDDELESALLNCDSGSGSTKTYYINGSYVRIRKGPGTSYDIIDELDYGTELTILEKYSTSWYYVQLKDGTKGYVATDYISSKTASGDLDLDFVKKQNLINKFCQYHHANGCIRGLLNRRLDEMEIFFFKDYDVDYGANNYGIKFSCANNPSFTA